MSFEYYLPTRILFGKGKLDRLGDMELPGKKALIVISSGTSMKRLGYVDRVIKLLEKNGIKSHVFSEVQPNPTKKNVMKGAAVGKSEGCDFIVGLGGGSSIDTAKSISIMMTNEGDYWDYIVGGTGKGLPISNDPLPVVAITTTAGTGTEADPWTVVTKEESNEKIGFGYDKTFPCLSIVDPELMMSVPKKLTTYQGFDALFHAIEGYIANTASEISDMYALKSIELIGRSLAKAVEDGSNEAARADVALANTLSGFVESTSSCTSEHSLAQAISAFHPEIAHGEALIMISEAYHNYCAQAVAERYIDIARALGVKESMSLGSFFDAFRSLKEACGVGNVRLSDYDIAMDDLEKYASNAIETMGGLFKLDPKQIGFDEAVEILRQSY